jgi:arylsulfatase A-like enzyme
MPEPKNVVCLVVDRLHSGFLGAYGNTWIATPNIDRLAAESFLLDRAYIDSPRLDEIYHSYWTGWHALAALAVVGSPLARNLPHQLTAAGYSTALVSDEPEINRLTATDAFHLFDRLELPTSAELCESIDETQLTRNFAVAIERLGEMRPPFFLWLHTGSLGKTWDAPPEFREQFRDADDPPLPETATVPCRMLSRDFDPDELLGIVHSYSGQVTLFDVCLGTLIEAISESSFAKDTLFVLISARGFPLGEHGRVGPIDDALYGELTQIPWLLRFPDGTGQSDRTQALVQPADLFATIADWCGLPVEQHQHADCGRSLLRLASGEVAALHDRAVTATSANEWAIATPAWYMKNRGGGRGVSREGVESSPPEIEIAGERYELFVKPDDRFEVNEVGDRCHECVEQLQDAFTQFQQACQSPDISELPPLPQVLVEGIE